MAKEIKFNIKLAIDGKEQLVTATYDVRKLQEVVNSARDSATRFRDVLITYNQAVDAIRNVADVFEPLRESLSRYGRGMAQAAQLTGLAGDELRVLGNQAQAMSSAFGTDINETMLAANSLAKGFGITAQDAMRLVQDGMVSGANANGQFLDVLKEYPRYFKEAGISAEAFVAITTNAARQGVFSDKGVDAIKEANIRLREMTPATQAALEGIGMSAEAVQQALRDGSATTFQIMQQVAARLQTLPASSAEVGAAIADIFGGPGEDAGLEYIKTLATVETSMDAVKAGADDYSKSLGEQASLIATLTNKLTSVIDLTQVYSTIAPALNVASQVGMSVVSLTAMAKSLHVLATTQVALRARTLAMGAATRAASAAMTAATAVSRTLQSALVGMGMAANTAKVAVRGLMVATGVGIAVAALTAVIGKLIDAFDSTGDAAEGASGRLQSVADTEDALTQTAARVQVELDKERDKLGQLMRAKADTADMVAHLNDTYGEAFGYYKTAAEWYDTLTRKSKAYAMAQGYAAQATAAATRLAEVELKGQRNNAERSRLWAEGKAVTDTYEYRQNGPGQPGSYVRTGQRDTEAYAALKKEGAALVEERRQLTETLDAARKALDKYAAQIDLTAGGDGKPAAPAATTTATPARDNAAEGSVRWYEQRIADLRSRMEATPDVGEARALREELGGAQAELTDLRVRIGIEKGTEPAAIAQSVNEQLQAAIEPLELPVVISGEEAAKARLKEVGQALGKGWGGLKESVGGVMSMTDVLESDASAWRKVTAAVDGAVQVFGGIKAVVEMVKMLTAATQVATATTNADTAASAANTTAKSGEAIANATASGAKLPFPANLAAIAAGVAAVVAALAMVGSFSTGGIVGGSSPTGDRLLARVNSGEMILNRSQQLRLLKLLSGSTAAVASSARGAGVAATVPRAQVASLSLSLLRSLLPPQGGGEVRFELRGRSLVATLANETRIASKSGRRTNIRI